MSRELTTRTILRVVFILVATALALYVVYLLRQPIGWLFLAAFIAMAVSKPVGRLSRSMPRGAAIAVVYLGLLFVPIVIGSLVIPTLVTEATELADDVPRYAREASEFIQENDRLRELDEKYDLGAQLEEQAAKLPAKAGDAAGVLSDISLSLVNSIFALVNIIILSIFMVASGGRWVHALLKLRPPDERERLERALTRVVGAVGGYVQGALTVAFIAGIAAYVVLLILGVPFRAPLAVMVGLFALIPLIGATIAAVLVGIVTLFHDFPTTTIIWVIWSIVYQQLENNIVQPQVQRRTVQVAPFVVLVAVLFGSALLGVVGALLAIPVAASLQIGLQEYLEYRREKGQWAPPADDGGDSPGDPPVDPPPDADPALAPA
ncbi:AI-2E family transporter [Conexibacter sp. SYSU D00693]|uniref:AI-2E family transporter n=1 Tax=Conexibacter sp. SYSU D00693 TaxID=2812560 RepID=UPI00196A32F7|nr:AI-2E family transporter [Conexibacter sp. SYSU D00693]